MTIPIKIIHLGPYLSTSHPARADSKPPSKRPIPEPIEVIARPNLSSAAMSLKNMENNTLWLPDGYGQGTIIYDIENKPYEATEYSGIANIYKIEPVEKEYAKKRIEEGVKKLVSTRKKS